jgi:hypothetical protein
MPRRDLLTSSERLQLLAFPEDEGELIRLYTLTKADLAFVRQHRGYHNRLGIAVMMSYLRYPGRVLAGDERPHGPILDIIAGQLGIPVDVWEVYAERDATRRSHLLELLPRLGMEQFGNCFDGRERIIALLTGLDQHCADLRIEPNLVVDGLSPPVQQFRYERRFCIIGKIILFPLESSHCELIHWLPVIRIK